MLFTAILSYIIHLCIFMKNIPVKLYLPHSGSDTLHSISSAKRQALHINLPTI